MEGLVKLAQAVLAGRRALDRAGAVARNGITALALAAIALPLLLAAIGCAVAALWIYAEPMLGPIGTPAAAAALFLLLAIILLAVARSLLRRPIPPSAVPAVDPAAALAEISAVVSRHKGAALAAALVAGLVAGTQDRR